MKSWFGISECWSEDSDVTAATWPSLGRDVHLARLWALGDWHVSIPQGMWGVWVWISMHLCVYVHACRCRCVCTCANAGVYVWVYLHMYVTAALEELQRWLSNFPGDASNSVHWPYSPKQLLAEQGLELFRKCAYHSLLGILCIDHTLRTVSGTGPGLGLEVFGNSRHHPLLKDWLCQDGSPGGTFQP